MLVSGLEITIKGDPFSVADLLRNLTFPLSTTCAAANTCEYGKIPEGYRATMEFERSKVLHEGNPNIFEHK